MEKLEVLASKAFRKCTKSKLYYSLYCLFSNIFIQMNHIEIYYLCHSNSEKQCCLDDWKESERFEIQENTYCRQCKILTQFNLLFTKISKENSIKLIFLIDKLVDFLFEHKYHLLSQLRTKKCKLDHRFALTHMSMTKM